MTNDDFAICRVDWLTREGAYPEKRREIEAHFWSLARFLQENELTTRALATSASEINDSFEVRKSDLTDLGFAVMKGAYHRQTRKIDRGGDWEDMSLLQKCLQQLRDKGQAT